MPHQERKHPDDSDIDVEYGNDVEEVWYEDDKWHGYDGRGEFPLDRGSSEPESDEYSYEQCNAVVTNAFGRYGERRYCNGPTMGNGLCQKHQNRASDAFVNNGKSQMDSGAMAKSHKTLFRYMEPYEKIMTNDIYRSLVNISVHDFNCDIYDLELTCEDSDIFEGEKMTIAHPIPTNKMVKCKALWYAALDFIAMEMIRKERFRTAFEQTHDPSIDADRVTIGERWTAVASGDDGAVFDKDEHHLNLALSRMQKDYEQEMEFGGVQMQPDSENDGDGQRDWSVTIIDDGDDNAGHVMDKLHPDEVSPLEDIEPDDG